jgi:diguanylate cyclase (GGDEF)-like protein/PAS domain S-box-containing protein
MRAREQLRESEERFRSLIELSSDWLWEQDDQFRFTFLNGGLIKQDEEKNGQAPIGKTRWDFPTLNLTEEDWARHRVQLERHEPFYDFEMRRPDVEGRERWSSVSGRPIFDSQGKFKGYRGVGRDITARKANEERIQYLATHDGLTNLPNRALFGEILNRTIQSSLRYNRKFAVLFIDLDRFKLINDTLGHEAGDMLLKLISDRLMQCLRTSDVVARLGGDEFVVLVHEVNDPKYVAMVADKILASIVQPIMLLDQECRVTASIGICMYPANAQDEQSMMKNADVAMYRAKEEGKNNYQFFSEDIKTQSLERLALETSLRRALERQQFFLHYQAKLDLKTRQITGVEALLRWQHPELGVVPPLQFIPLAEETGLIVQIGQWVLNTACAQNAAWQREGIPPICMAVNLSARQFADEFLLDHIAAALRESGMDPQLLELELTESLVIQNPERAIKLLLAIKKLGVRLAIDDFGTGYSSLGQLKHFPIDTLKVDRSFIRDIPRNAEDKAITKAIIAMGKTLSMTVVAEGVETEEQETFLRDEACDEIQGFFFSKPIAPDKFAELFREHRKNK